MNKKIKILSKSYDKIKETKFYYDDRGFKGISDKGALTKTEQWNNNGNDTFTYFEYDTFGNVFLERKT